MNQASSITHVFPEPHVHYSTKPVWTEWALVGTYASAGYKFRHVHPCAAGMGEESVVKMSLADLFQWSQWLTEDLTAFKAHAPEVFKSVRNADALINEACAGDKQLLDLVNKEAARRFERLDKGDGTEQFHERRALQAEIKELTERLDNL